MGFLVALIASIALLLGSAVLLSTVGRRGRKRTRPLAQSEVAAIEGVAGSELAGLVAAAVALRQRIEDVLASGREMLAVERHLAGSPRRPLWRQIEDANFGHELDGLRREAATWLARFDALDATERQIVERLALDVEPVRALVEPSPMLWRHEAPGVVILRDRSEELAAVHARLEAAITCLRRVEREISSYRSGYR